MELTEPKKEKATTWEFKKGEREKGRENGERRKRENLKKEKEQTENLKKEKEQTEKQTGDEEEGRI